MGAFEKQTIRKIIQQLFGSAFIQVKLEVKNQPAEFVLC